MLAATLLPFPAYSQSLKLSQGLPEARTGRYEVYGYLGAEAENYQYSSPSYEQTRDRFKGILDIGGRGYVWDPRFLTLNAGLTFSRETIQHNQGETQLNMLGYRLSSSLFPASNNPLVLHASRAQSTVADYWTPSYNLTTTTAGARWGFDSAWLGRARMTIDSTKSESASPLVPRSDDMLSYGIEANKRILLRQFGESDLNYGYRHNEWKENVRGSNQQQDHFYLYDRTKLGDTANLNATVTYYQRNDQWAGLGGTGGNAIDSNYLNINSQLMIQQTDDFRHFYTVAINNSTMGQTSTQGYNASAGANYQYNPHWRVSGTLGINTSQAKSNSATAFSQSTNNLQGSGNVQYSDRFGNYLVNGGYTIAWQSMRMDIDNSTTVYALPVGNTGTTHSLDTSFTRTGSPRYTDSLQLRLSQRQGTYKSDERNLRYSVNSLLGQHDALQGLFEYRAYNTETPIVSANSGIYSIYLQSSTTTRIDLAWLHRFSASSSVSSSVGQTVTTTQSMEFQSRYAQARLNTMLRSNMQFTALARLEQLEGIQTIAGTKTTLEADLLYRLGKWQAIARYRLREADFQLAPFKEHSIFFSLRRDYGFQI